MTARMRRAPFAGEIERLLKIAPAVSWRLFAGGSNAERWQRAQRWTVRGHHAASLLPVGCDPAALRWPSGTCLADVSWLPGALVQGLAKALIRDGCTHALLIDLADPARTMHAKPTPHEVAA